MVDDYTPHKAGLESPPVAGVQWTPSDTEDLPFVCRGFNIAEASALKVDWWDPTAPDGQDRTTETIPTGMYAAGITHPARFIRIYATGTTVTAVGIRR